MSNQPSGHPPEGERPESDPYLQGVNEEAARLREEREERTRGRHMREQQRLTRQESQRALNIRTEIVTDVSDAPRLYNRHHVHVRLVDLATDLYQAYVKRDQDRTEAIAIVEDHREQAQEAGIFLLDFPQTKFEDRILSRHSDGSPEYVIAESYGTHPDQDHPRHSLLLPAADAQFRTPEARRGAKRVFVKPMEEKGDIIRRPELLKDLLEHPYSVAQAEDLAADPDMLRLQLASAAFDKGLMHMREVINPTRGDYPIEHVVGEVVSVRGIRLKGQMNNILLDREIPAPPILNGRSMTVLDHFKNPHVTHFETAWILADRKIPLVNHPYVAYLIANWYVLYAELKK